MDASTTESNRIATRRVLVIILALNLIVCLAKLAVGAMAQSLAVMSDGVHSSIDAINNIFGIVLLRMAAKGPDADHPYGHGKIETLGAFSIAGFMLITCYEIVKQSVVRFWKGETARSRLPPSPSWSWGRRSSSTSSSCCMKKRWRDGIRASFSMPMPFIRKATSW